MNEIVFPLGLFALSMCITPGPNNIMLTASGANFGFRKTIPHILGVEFGLLFMFILSAFGLGILFELFPQLQTVLKYVSICYLFYLSYRIGCSKRSDRSRNSSKPLSIYEAALFQLVNPKVFLMAFTALSTFSVSGSNYVGSVILIIVVFATVCIPAITVWAGFGTIIGRFLQSDKAYKIFNIAMGILTASSVIQVI